MTENKICTGICYQSWVDMFNQKDKQCFDLQLQVGKLQHDMEVLTSQLEKANKEVCQEKEKNAVLRQKLEQQEQDWKQKLDKTKSLMIENDITAFNKSYKYEQALKDIKSICIELLNNGCMQEVAEDILYIINKAKGIYND